MGRLANKLRPVGSIDFAASTPKSIDLPRDYFIKNILLTFAGTSTITTAGSPVIYTEGSYKYVQRIEIIKDGKDTIKSLPFTAIRNRNIYDYSNIPSVTHPAVTGTAATSLLAVGILNFQMPRAIKPIDTMLDASKCSTLELRATFGSIQAGYSTAPTVEALTAGKLHVDIEEAVGVPPAEPTIYQERFLEKTVSATGESQILLPIGLIYRGFMIYTERDGNPVNDILTGDISLSTGLQKIHTIDGDRKRYLNKLEHSLATIQTGYYNVDLCPDGLLSEALDARNLSSLYLNLNVTKTSGTEKMYIFPQSMVI